MKEQARSMARAAPDFYSRRTQRNYFDEEDLPAGPSSTGGARVPHSQSEFTFQSEKPAPANPFDEEAGMFIPVHHIHRMHSVTGKN